MLSASYFAFLAVSVAGMVIDRPAVALVELGGLTAFAVYAAFGGI